MSNGLPGIQYNIEKADRTDKKVQNLASYINADLLREMHRGQEKGKASGVDGVTKEEYDRDLEGNLKRLVNRMKCGNYYPNPSKRIYIPKDGKGKMRPLGISSYEDRLVENAVAQILVRVYEPKFYDESYGFRPGRNCHMAVREVIRQVKNGKTNYVVEADIRSFFDTVDHGWLMKMLGHDIADKRFLGIIRRLLEAGIMENGRYIDREEGAAQGNGASPVLANVFLHYVLDNWFDVVVRRQCRGEAHLIRYADDFVCCFQCKEEAEVFRKRLEERFRKYGLELAEEKTKILEFGRFAGRDKDGDMGKSPETFDFLGFTFYCGMDSRKRFFRCKVKTSKKKFRSKIRSMKQWIKDNRTRPVKEIIETVNAKLRGHYQYYGVTDNLWEIQKFRDITRRLLFKWLNRRSQKKSYTADAFYHGLLRTFPILEPSIKVSLISR